MLPKETPRFITFEGGEGAGKSTQIKRLSTYLNELSVPHLLTREPGGTALAEKIRTLLVTGKADAMDPLTEYLLFSAARRDHLEKIIKPALTQGSWVLCDRFYDSSYVYQGLSPQKDKALDLSFMDSVYKEIAGSDFEPSLTFVFDIDPKIGLTRVQKRCTASTDKKKEQENRFESKGLDFHNRIRQGFLKLQSGNPHRCRLIDGSQPIDQTFQHIRSILEDL
ncbi:MAG: dTMP kinase [Alphaproteobacteria bacterium]|nr:dTMP kinase [Alphaproteobacteria bacterium]NCQ66750.1 dTMP kinase [Alphaproteobacteria bacterium]NCT07201.1 dTMP kinase [Alphaproteobacteria bacterium]